MKTESKKSSFNILSGIDDKDLQPDQVDLKRNSSAKQEKSYLSLDNSPNMLTNYSKESYLKKESQISCSDKEYAVLKLPDGQECNLEILIPTIGPKMLNISEISSKLKMFTQDPGFMTTGSCKSEITFINGEKGELWQRGYPIEQLADFSSHLETCFLLINGELPSTVQYKSFQNSVMINSTLNTKMLDFQNGFQKGSHPMSILTGVVAAMSSFFNDNLNIQLKKDREITSIRLIAKLPTIAAYAFRKSNGLDFIHPKYDKSQSENFLQMLFADSNMNNFCVPQIFVEALDKIMILHADHEQNASTSTVRIASSSLANPYACISAGIASLWGPLHGGANEAVLTMLDQIGSKENIPIFIERAKDKNDPFRLMGFGHRVYKNFDPRAKIMKEMCDKVLNSEQVDKNSEKKHLLEIALELEKVALNDEQFISRKLYPNVDFQSGIVLTAIGIPINMFTVIFAVSRTVGWISQWKESVEEETFRISRPRQLYIGKNKRDYVHIEKRESELDTKYEINDFNQALPSWVQQNQK